MLLILSGSVVCNYLPDSLEAEITNGSPTRMLILGKWKLGEEFPEGACPTLLAETAHMTVTRAVDGLPLYLAGQ